MSIKMIGLDLDQTYLNSDKHLIKENVDAVREAMDKGIVVLPVTGRPFTAITEEILLSGPFRYAIAAGGAVAFDLTKKEKLFEILFPEDVIVPVVEALIDHHYIVNLYYDGQGYVKDSEEQQAILNAPTEAAREYLRRNRIRVPDMRALLYEHAKEIEKLTISMPWADGIMHGVDELMTILHPYEDRMNTMYGTEINVEIQAKDAAKGKAMIKLGKLLGIERDEIMAVGDSDNDLEMVEAIGLGVAMGNANAHVKAAADVVVPDNDSAGVAYAIRQYALQDKNI